jgi:hypothetical protein
MASGKAYQRAGGSEDVQDTLEQPAGAQRLGIGQMGDQLLDRRAQPHLHALSACCLAWSRSLVRRSRSLAELAQAEAGTNSFRRCWMRVSMSSRDAPHHLHGLAGRVLEPPALIALARIARAGIAAYWDGNQAGSHGAAQPPSRSHRGLMPWPARYVRAHGPADDGTIGPVGHERRSVGVHRGPSRSEGSAMGPGLRPSPVGRVELVAPDSTVGFGLASMPLEVVVWTQ